MACHNKHNIPGTTPRLTIINVLDGECTLTYTEDDLLYYIVNYDQITSNPAPPTAPSGPQRLHPKLQSDSADQYSKTSQNP